MCLLDEIIAGHPVMMESDSQNEAHFPEMRNNIYAEIYAFGDAANYMLSHPIASNLLSL